MFEFIWLWLDRCTILVAACSAVFACWAWGRSKQILDSSRRAAARRREPITIRLVVDDDRTLDLPYRPRRDQLSRVEVLGLLGMYYGPDRFPAQFFEPVLRDGSLSRVIEGKLDSDLDEILRIPVTSEIFDRIAKGTKP